MSLEISLIYTILLVFFTLVLAIRVLDLRNSPVTKFLHSPNRQIDPEMLQRAIRAHGNLIENAPDLHPAGQKILDNVRKQRPTPFDAIKEKLGIEDKEENIKINDDISIAIDVPNDGVTT